MAAPQTSIATARVAFSYPNFGLYQLARFCIVLATEMQSVAVGWQVYEITKRPLDLGLVGLAQFLPGVLSSACRSPPLFHRIASEYVRRFPAH